MDSSVRAMTLEKNILNIITTYLYTELKDSKVFAHFHIGICDVQERS